MKKISHIILLSISACLTLSAAVTSSIAWFKDGGYIDFGSDDNNGQITATTNGAYFGHLQDVDDDEFAYGYTPENPYVISTPTHLYNLAWLQYIGYFNTNKYVDDPSGIKQCYFTVTNNIDMDGMILPPIGTELYPFFGNFNGGGYTISNLTISNDDPLGSDSIFSTQYAKPSDNVLEGLPSTRVVGFFGIVGEYGSTTAPTGEGTFTPAMKDVTISDITVESKTEETLIGIAAGYVDGDMDGVKVGGTSTIDLGSTGKANLNNNITQKLSNYGLVGYTAETGTSGTFTQKLSEFYDNKDLQTDSGSNWGGSLNFNEFAQRIFTIIGGGSGSDVIETNTGTARDPSYYWTYSDNNNKVSISMQTGGITEDPNAPTNTNKKLTYNCNQDTVMPFSVYTQEDFNEANSYEQQSYKINDLVKYNNNFYRCINAIEDEDGETWNAAHWQQVFINEAKPTNTGYIVGCNTARNGKTKIASSPQGFIGASLIKSGSTNTSTTYASTSNAGAYTEILTPMDPSATPSSSGTANFCVIKDSYNENAIDTNNTNLPTASGGKLNGYTIKNLQELGFDKTKKYSKSRKTIHQTFLSSSNVQGLRFDTFTVGTGTEKIVTVSNPFVTRINDKNSASEIGDNKTASSGSSYALLAGSVQFNLKHSGYINFFGGNYTNSGSGAGTFFKLFSVNRTSNTTIASVDEIFEIWTNENADTKEEYPYIYTNANTTSSPTSNQIIEIGYSRNNVTPGNKLFDFRYLLSNVGLVANALYYYEIPVNSGEFCIGSTGSSGGYLLYLDIGASEIDNKDRVTAYSITTVRTGNSYPVGVDFAVKNVTGEGSQTFGIGINSNEHGSIAFKVETEEGNNYISVDIDNCNVAYSYQGSLFSANDPPDGNFIVTGDEIGALQTTNPVGGERVLTITIEPASGADSTTVTIIDQLDENGGFLETESQYFIDDELCDNREELEDLSNELSLEVIDGTFRTLHLHSILTRAGTSGDEFSVSYLLDSIHCDYSDKEIDITIETNSSSMAIMVENGYYLFIDEQSYLSGSTYP